MSFTFHKIFGAGALSVLLTLGAPLPARADGCTVLLCLAGNWKNISQCVPPVRRALRDAARGRGWPSCGMASASGSASNGNTASNVRSWYETGCPVQYTIRYSAESGIEINDCVYSHSTEVVVNGQVWSRVWWSMFAEMDTSTEYFPAARAQLTASDIDPQFDNDLRAYNDRIAAEEAARQAALLNYSGF